ncbi:MAG: phasin family protein, partial [Mesorhizobium sp.]
LFSAKSFDKAIEIQSDYAKQSYESFVAEAAKIGDLYAELAKEAYKPFESIVAKAK